MSSEDDIAGEAGESGETSASPHSSERPGPTSLLATMRSSQDEISEALLYDAARAARGPAVRIEEAVSDEPEIPAESNSRPLLVVLLVVLSLGAVGALWWFAFSTTGG